MAKSLVPQHANISKPIWMTTRSSFGKMSHGELISVFPNPVISGKAARVFFVFDRGCSLPDGSLHGCHRQVFFWFSV